MAKTLRDFKKSALQRQKILDKYGGEVPDSVWVAAHTENSRIQDTTTDQTKKRTEHWQKRLSKTDQPHLLEKCRMSGMSVRGKGGGLSKFPINILQRVIKFYTEPGDIVLDPCAGHNSRMQGTYELGRSYIGYDVCHEFMEFNRNVAAKIQKKNDLSFFKNEATITLHEQSSESMVEEDESIDLIFTSPPYWDLEFYDDNPAQIGYNHTYDEFLDGIERIAKESLRVLKPGKLAVINVNDFRKDGKFYAYHMDLTRRFLNVGFELFDIIIMVWSPQSIRSIFATQVEESKITGKVHEYLIVFRKPK